MECGSENLKETTTFEVFRIGDYVKVTIDNILNIGKITKIEFDNYNNPYFYLEHLICHPYYDEVEKDESRGYFAPKFTIEKITKEEAYMLANSYKSKPNCVNNYTENILKDIKDLLWKYGVK